LIHHNTKYDTIIIGSGPNGLAAAIELARNGQKVLVVESASEIGGGTRTTQLTLPNFRHDYCSAVHPMGVLSPYLKTLPLEKYGLEWVYPKISVAHPLDDEPAVLLGKSLEKTADNLGVDGKTWKNLFSYFIKNGDALLGLNALWPATTFANAKFKGKRAKALFAGCAGHSVLPLDFYFTSALGMMFSLTAHLVDWPVAKGGSHNITKAMASLFKELGGEIQTNFLVKKLSDLPDAKTYLFNTDPKQLAKIAADELPNSYKKRLLKYNYGPGVLRCLDASTVHVGGSMEEIARSERMAWEGKHYDKPYLILCQQSQFDNTRAPKGKHTGYAYCHVPHGSTKDMTMEIENQIERFAPGFKDLILPNPKIFIGSAATPPGGGVHGMCGYWAAQSILKRYIGNRMAEVLLEKDWVTGVVGTDIKCHGTSGRKKNGRRL